MTEAERLFNEIFARWINRVGFLHSFRRTSTEGLRGAQKAIETENARFVDNLTNNPEYDKIFLDKNSFFEMIPPEKLIQELTGTTVQLAQRGVDAASIVFAHSIVDAAAFDYCRVTALVAPGDWESIIDQRQIKLSDLRGTSYDQILRKKLDEFFE